MTKRPHPDGASADNSPMQLKTHVGQKEVDQGVNAEENMKKVFDKTLNMMMEGAKEQARIEKQEDEAEMKDEEKKKEETKEEEEENKVEPGQMYFNTKGEIAGVYVAVPDEEAEKKDNGDEKMEENGEKKEENGEKTETNGADKGDGDKKESNGQSTEDKGKEGGDGEKTEETEKDPDQPSLEKFGFKVDECSHKSPIKAVRLSPAKSPAKSPYKLEKRPLKLDEKMEEDK